MKTITRLTSGLIMAVAVVVLATGALIAGVSVLIESIHND